MLYKLNNYYIDWFCYTEYVMCSIIIWCFLGYSLHPLLKLVATLTVEPTWGKHQCLQLGPKILFAVSKSAITSG